MWRRVWWGWCTLCGCLGLLGIVVVGFDLISGERTGAATLGYSDFFLEVGKGHVHSVAISATRITGTLDDHTTFVTEIPANAGIADSLIAKSIHVVAVRDDDSPYSVHLIVNWMPLVIYLFVIWAWLGKPLQRIAAAVERQAIKPNM